MAALLLLFALFFSAGDAAAAKVPALYVFGDSTADVGNNNYLPPGSAARADFPHNGIDFPLSRPTGRFSNGYNGIDFLATYMGFRRSPPPFLSLANKTSHKIMRGQGGVSFASGGSGILESTGGTITMTKQIHDFASIQLNLVRRMPMEQTALLLSKSIFIISSGGNDIFAFFSKNKFPSSSQTKQFIENLVSSYQDHLLALYTLGARKFGIIDVPPIGCCPYPRSLNPTGDCIKVLNELARVFNEEVKVLMQSLSSSMDGIKYSIGSSNAVVTNIIKNPTSLGFKEVKAACCGAGRFNGESGCMPNATYCLERNRYLFWDLLHPTHATSKLAGLAIYSGSLQFASPINFKQLAEDDM